MISLILPYWDRQPAADRALAQLDACYHDLHDLEVIVVDDGNAVPFVPPETRLNLRVVRLPEKSAPTPQSRAWNAGVTAARGDLIALSCIEVLHERPVLAAMAEHLGMMGPDGYVLAAAWCSEQQAWHCHSQHPPEGLPAGTGASFLGLMRRELFEKAGGFDEAYHDGAGYEDKDFIRRLLVAGADFAVLDDLVVTHPKSGAQIAWPAEGFARNEAIYRRRWGLESREPVTFVCLKAGGAYGPEYVNILRDMVARNLPAGFPGKFVCLTDDPRGLDVGIETLPLPDDLETWWGKLYLFKRGLFPDGSRVVFMDLDTLILGPLDDLAAYDGAFATLRDFYFPQQLGPAVIAWEAGGPATAIWDAWEAEGKPRNPMGDLWWINTFDQGCFARAADVLQDRFPRAFASFKADCHPLPPAGTRVVCFHGQPKPHNCPAAWVIDVWRVGGGGMTELEAVANTADATVAANVRAAVAAGYPWVSPLPADPRPAVIVAGGPSLAWTIPEVRARAAAGEAIFAVNGAARLLNEEGVIPEVQVVIDARPENARFVAEATAQEYLFASQCAPEVFSAAGRGLVGVFHLNTPGIADLLPPEPPATLISAGTTVGLAALALAYVLGHREISLYGFDSSYTERHHAYPQPENDADAVLEVSAGGRAFKAAPWMVMQAQQFQDLARQLAEEGVTITVAGDGLLPHIARCMTQPQGAYDGRQ